TILPDLAGHHLIQPYGKEYKVMAEQLWKDLPKHMKNFGEKVVVAGRDVIDHFRAMKAEIDRRVQKLR
ncbi:unnamed protein product, partial [Rotaria magnacalcarata]